MRDLVVACTAEYLKLRRSKVLWLTVLALCLGPLFGSLFVIVLRDPALAQGNEALRAKAELTGFAADWPSFFNLVSQVIGVGGVIVFGFMGSWMFGREYSDRTLKDLFVMPVRRSLLVYAKAIVCFAWCFVAALTVTVVSLAVGTLLGLEGWSGLLFLSSLRHILATTVLSALLCPPVFVVASAGKGYLASLGFVIFTVVLAQIIGALGYGAYVPWAVPALFSGLGSETGGSVGTLSYLVVLLTAVLGLGATVYWWNRADQAG